MGNVALVGKIKSSSCGKRPGAIARCNDASLVRAAPCESTLFDMPESWGVPRLCADEPRLIAELIAGVWILDVAGASPILTGDAMRGAMARKIPSLNICD